MKKIQYIFVCAAMMMMMLTTIMVHHHHGNQICTVKKICTIDQKINDKHTSHPQNEVNGCQLLQMHNFTSNAKGVQKACNTSTSHFPSLFALFANIIIDYNNFDDNIADCQNRYIVLVQAKNTAYSRRGPPVL